MTIPDGYVLRQERKLPLLIGGGLVFAAVYGVSLGVAASENFGNGTGWLVLPGVGPWVTITQRESPCAEQTGRILDTAASTECANAASVEAGAIGLLVVNGLVQTAALIVTGIGVFSKNEYLEYEPRVGVRPAPIGVRGGAGFGLVGRF